MSKTKVIINVRGGMVVGAYAAGDVEILVVDNDTDTIDVNEKECETVKSEFIGNETFKQAEVDTIHTGKPCF